MHLIIGGTFQGKTDWAKARFGLKDAEIEECTEQALPDLSAKCITHLERFALCCLRQGKEPKTVLLQAKEIREALADSLDAILEAVRTTLEVIPPELSADIIDRGLTLTGGGALLRGLDQLLSKETGISVHVAQNPLDCVAIGTGLVLNNRAIQETVAAEELAD